MNAPFHAKRAPLPLRGGACLDFSFPLVMAIVNCTPDSFYPESRTAGLDEALRAALCAEEEGAGIVDFGAESTRPGAKGEAAETELARLLPVLRAFRRQSSLPVSVDTRKAAVAAAALDEGADIINDVSALSDPQMAGLCAKHGAALVLTHAYDSHFSDGANEGLPPPSRDVVAGTRDFLAARAARAQEAGIAGERIIIDPGFGFGKTTEENLALLARLAEIGAADYPVLAGLSRKRFIGEITGRGVEGRLAGTLAACYAALRAGADILRVHDTAAARDIAAVFCALERREG